MVGAETRLFGKVGFLCCYLVNSSGTFVSFIQDLRQVRMGVNIGSKVLDRIALGDLNIMLKY